MKVPDKDSLSAQTMTDPLLLRLPPLPPDEAPIIFSISEHDFGCLITFLEHNIYEVKQKQVIEYLLNLGFTASGTMATKTGCFWKAYILGFSLGTGAPAQHCIAAVKTSCKII